MTPRLGRLAALVAVFAPERAELLFSRVSASDDVKARAAALARRPRQERLAALATAFSSAKLAERAALGRGHLLWQRLARESLVQRSTGLLIPGTDPLSPPPPSALRTVVQPPDA